MLLQSSYDIQWESVSGPFGAPYLDQNPVWPLEFTQIPLEALRVRCPIVKWPV
jgi:hypothetical protein